jgi:hypothetical protein
MLVDFAMRVDPKHWSARSTQNQVLRKQQEFVKMPRKVHERS